MSPIYPGFKPDTSEKKLNGCNNFKSKVDNQQFINRFFFFLFEENLKWSVLKNLL